MIPSPKKIDNSTLSHFKEVPNTANINLLSRNNGEDKYERDFQRKDPKIARHQDGPQGLLKVHCCNRPNGDGWRSYIKVS